MARSRSVWGPADVSNGSFWQSSLFHWFIAIWVIGVVFSIIGKARRASQNRKAATIAMGIAKARQMQQQQIEQQAQQPRQQEIAKYGPPPSEAELRKMRQAAVRPPAKADDK